MNIKTYIQGYEVKPERALEGLGELENGIFETLRAYNGVIFRAEEHLERLCESAQDTGLTLPCKISEIKKDLEAALRHWRANYETKLKDAVVSLRVTVWENDIFVLIGPRFLSMELFEKGASLRTSAFRRSSSNASAPEAKTNAYQNAVLAMFDPDPKPDERLFLDGEGFVAEAGVGNIFMIKKECLLTPPARGILNGVTRRFVLECALLAGIQTSESPLTRHEFYNADEVFLTNTSWEILPVREIDGRRIGESAPGPLTRKLSRTFKKRILVECRKSSSAAL